MGVWLVWVGVARRVNESALEARTWGPGESWGGVIFVSGKLCEAEVKLAEVKLAEVKLARAQVRQAWSRRQQTQ